MILLVALAAAADLQVVDLEPSALDPDPGWTVAVPDGRIVDTHSFAWLVGDTNTFELLSDQRRQATLTGAPLLALGIASLMGGIWYVQDADDDLTQTRRGRWASAGGAVAICAGAIRIGGTWGSQFEVQGFYTREEAEAWIERSR